MIYDTSLAISESVRPVLQSWRAGSLRANSHADGTHSIPFYEGVLSRVAHPNLVALPEHRALAVKSGPPATAGSLSLMAWRGTSFCAGRGWATLRAGNRLLYRPKVPDKMRQIHYHNPYPKVLGR